MKYSARVRNGKLKNRQRERERERERERGGEWNFEIDNAHC